MVVGTEGKVMNSGESVTMEDFTEEVIFAPCIEA